MQPSKALFVALVGPQRVSAVDEELGRAGEGVSPVDEVFGPESEGDPAWVDRATSPLKPLKPSDAGASGLPAPTLDVTPASVWDVIPGMRFAYSLAVEQSDEGCSPVAKELLGACSKILYCDGEWMLDEGKATCLSPPSSARGGFEPLTPPSLGPASLGPRRSGRLRPAAWARAGCRGSP